MRKPTLMSLFSGAGGLDIGLEDSGFDTLLANEIEPPACESLRQNRILRSLGPDEFDHWFDATVLSQKCYRGVDQALKNSLYGRLRGALKANENYLTDAVIVERDVRSLSVDDALDLMGLRKGELDLIAGGPPCQPFSRSGKRELVDCDTGQLFTHFVRLVAGIRPRWFLFENVKGLVIHKADLAYLRCDECDRVELSSFDNRDAIKMVEFVHSRCDVCTTTTRQTVEWKSKRAGSLEIIEHEFSKLGYKCSNTVLNAADFGAPQSRERLFIIGSRDHESFRWPEKTHAAARSATPFIRDLFENPKPLQPWRTLRETLYSDGHWRFGSLDSPDAVLWVKNVVRPHDEPVTWSLDRVAPTVGAHQSAKFAIAPRGVPEAQLARQQWHVLGRRQGDTPPVFVEHEYLSDEELLKLQTFPTSWYLHGTRMQRAFQIGNAVPPALAAAVGKSLYTAITSESPTNEQEPSLVAHYASSF